MNTQRMDSKKPTEGYKIVRCSTCGQERYQVRLVRLTRDEQKGLNTSRRGANWTGGISFLILWLFAVTFVATFIVVAVAMQEEDPRWKIALAIGVSTVLATFLGFLWTVRYYNRKERVLKTIEQQLAASYGVPQDEAYEFVS